ncbi:MAG: helix-turn-helix transcriptional regulator [Ferrovibrio sp.]
MTAPKLLDAIEAVYDAAIDPAGWNKALQVVTQHTGATGFNLFIVDNAVGRVCHSEFLNIPDGLLDCYYAYYIDKDPGMRFFAENPNEGIYYNYLHSSEDEIERSEYYSWLQSAGGSRYYLATTFTVGKRFSCIASSQRDHKVGHAQSGDIENIRQLTPHFQRAVQINQMFNTVDLRLGAARDALELFPYGVFLLDNKGEVIFTNHMAQSMLAERDGVMMTNQRLGALHITANRRLHEAVRQCLQAAAKESVYGGDAFTIARVTDGRYYTIEVVPLMSKERLFTESQPAVLVLLGDPQRGPRLRSQQIRDMYGLTATEAEIAILLAQGTRPAEICRIKGISPNTLKTHRRRLFDKLEVETQAQLARMINVG